MDAATALAASLHWCSAGHFLFRGGCYNISATGSGVCREARDGACVMYREMGAQKRRPVDSGRRGAHDSMQGAERVRAAQCTTGNDGESTKCKNTKCDVWINGVQYCSQCAKADEFLVNGVCKTTNEDSACATPSSPTDGTCKSCKAGYFLHEGGCYKVAESPGSFICSTEGDAGLCSACKNENGFFKNPSATVATKQSCIACNRTAAVDNVKGVEGCTACGGPDSAGSQGVPTTTTCSACSNSKIVKIAKDKTTSCIDESACNNGFFVKEQDGSKTCEACDSTCKTCSGTEANQCTSCQDSGKKYLKKTDNSQTGTCIDEAGCIDGNYIDEAAKTCSTCASARTTDCTTCEKGADGVVVCKTCTTGEKTIFGLNKKSCVAECPADSTKVEDQGKQVCTCNDGFTPSTDSSACVAASSGSNLSGGVIAGISVTVIVMMSGLVDFLCQGSVTLIVNVSTLAPPAPVPL
ncbi:Chromosome segregation ATPase [Giardia duodenalis]|uniref:Chromosome segregation ATPase n=1 Tax=Giardia intestinalis TaxID=5741 RepID=V6TYM6_GIAIN|nr:Chromosome segregation ATPase [Giardia intestinalis]